MQTAVPADIDASPAATVTVGSATPGSTNTGMPTRNTTLDSVQITGARQPYRNLSATGATKNDTLVKDLPMSVRVIDAGVLSDAGVNDLAGALAFSSGLSNANDFGGLWNSYAMRGFTGDPNFGSDYMVNGFNSSRGYNGLRDGANTATVEVLKGPSSALYGRGEPGGTVNIATKKPFFEPAHTVDVGVSSWNTWRTAIDFTGPLSEKLAYRLNAVMEDGDSFRDTVEKKHHLVAPSFLWMISDETTLSYEIEALEQRTPLDRGVVASSSGELGIVPVSRFLGEPGDGPITIKSLGHQVFLQHHFNDDWSVQTGLSYRKSSMQGLATEAWRWDPNAVDRTLLRFQRSRDFKATDVSGRLELLGKAASGPVKHSMLVGVDAYHFDDTRKQRRGRGSVDADTGVVTDGYAIDIVDPVYGLTMPAPLVTLQDTDETQRSLGVYAQDQFEFTPQWKALIGLRHDSYRQTVIDPLQAEGRRRNDQDLSATSPRLGIVYQPDHQWSLYATASKGFRPNSGISRQGEAFQAETSKSYEVGAKFETADGKLSGTAAAYRITKENVLTFDPLDTVYYIAVGEVESRGFELDLSGELTKRLRLTAAYAYTDAEVTKSIPEAASTGMAEGRKFPNVPRHSANLFAIYSLSLDDGGMANIGGGLTHVGKRVGSVDVADAFMLPAYTTFKVVSSYSIDRRLRLSLTVDNVFDKTYYPSSYSSLWVTPGTERRFSLNAQYKF